MDSRDILVHLALRCAPSQGMVLANTRIFGRKPLQPAVAFDNAVWPTLIFSLPDAAGALAQYDCLPGLR